ncbi:MAG: fatty acid desaturase [Betaproteobacteria bacterium]|nr:fatty acid desaturase [Betaproteobacteria bacterium]
MPAHTKLPRPAIAARYARAEDVKGFSQVVTTLGPIALLWWGIALSTEISYWLTAGITLLMSFFLLRVFVLMHECGHASLFRTRSLNKACGFVFGVFAGMPQYVWSEHHAYHHATNGNWSKYRGPLSIVTVADYAAMNPRERRNYRYARTIWLAFFAGLSYLVLSPRINWIKGSIGLLSHLIRRKIAEPAVSLSAHAATFKTRYWSSPKQYAHMLWNNVVLLAAWVLMSMALGPLVFFPVYVISVSLAGAAGIVLFTVQHNFEHSYASEDEGWEVDTAATKGTSFLLFPGWLNWFTANIAYHHVHHLSVRIPNYRLVDFHNDHAHLFRDVTRIKLSRIHAALQCILWDTSERRIISVAEFNERT